MLLKGVIYVPAISHKIYQDLNICRVMFMITFVSLNDKFFNIYVHKNKSKRNELQLDVIYHFLNIYLRFPFPYHTANGFPTIHVGFDS